MVWALWGCSGSKKVQGPGCDYSTSCSVPVVDIREYTTAEGPPSSAFSFPQDTSFTTSLFLSGGTEKVQQRASSSRASSASALASQ